MLEQPNVRLMRRVSELFIEGDMTSLKRMINETAIWHIPGRSPVGGNYRGHPEIFGLFEKLMHLSNGTFKVEVRDVTASADHAVNIEWLAGKRDGKTLNTSLVLIAQIRDAKLTEVWEAYGDQYAWDEFWS